MKNRIVFGLIMIAAMVGVFYADHWLEQATREAIAKRASAIAAGATPIVGAPLSVLLAVLATLSFGEMSRFSLAAGVRTLSLSGLLGTLAVGACPFWWQFLTGRSPNGAELLVILGFVVMAAFAEQMIRHRIEDAFRRVAVTVLAVAYLGVGGAIILNIRVHWNVPMLILFLAAVKCTDIGAYFTGSAIGRHKMIPWLSPGKSWEGLAGGVVSAAMVSVALATAFHIPFGPAGGPPWMAAVFGAAVGVVGQFADLCESLLKRSVQLKDSGAVVPGFGGMLDILDSPLLAAPVGYLLLSLMLP